MSILLVSVCIFTVLSGCYSAAKAAASHVAIIAKVRKKVPGCHQSDSLMQHHFQRADQRHDHHRKTYQMVPRMWWRLRRRQDDLYKAMCTAIGTIPVYSLNVQGAPDTSSKLNTVRWYPRPVRPSVDRTNMLIALR